MNFEAIILTSPDQGITLEKDIRLIKLALLYSDKVTLVSPKTSFISATMQLGNLSQHEQIELIKEVGPILDKGFNSDALDLVLKQVGYLKKKKHKTRQELIALGNFKHTMTEINDSLQQMSQKVYSDSQFHKLTPLIENGTLTVRPFKFDSDQETIAQNMLNEVIDVLNTTTTKYPVFDELIGDIAHHYSIEHKLQYNQHNPRQIEFGRELLLQIPNIDNIEISDLVNLKGELSIELSRFKGVIMDYSNQIESLPFSSESRMEMKSQYEYHIKPELEILKEKINQNRLIKHLTNEAFENASSYATQFGVFLCICSFLDLEKLLAVGGVLTESTYKALKAKNETSANIKKNPLFFYHELTNLGK